MCGRCVAKAARADELVRRLQDHTPVHGSAGFAVADHLREKCAGNVNRLVWRPGREAAKFRIRSVREHVGGVGLAHCAGSAETWSMSEGAEKTPSFGTHANRCFTNERWKTRRAIRTVRPRNARKYTMPRRTDIHTILIIGSGPIVIGQGCEFDYSGVQACRALKEEGYRIVLINSQPRHDHDRSGVRRRDLHRADHAGGRREDSRSRSCKRHPGRCAAADAGRADRAEHRHGMLRSRASFRSTT